MSGEESRRLLKLHIQHDDADALMLLTAIDADPAVILKPL